MSQSYNHDRIMIESQDLPGEIDLIIDPRVLALPFNNTL